MTAYYNEFDPKAAAWLRELIKQGHIADGVVDERSIEDVTPNDLAGFTQCHFFAGIGVWSYALRSAGWADDRPVWTGSCPCQPFSAAGKGAGFADERHLWPAFHHLISQCRPDIVLGEQVASKDGLGWLDLVQADLESAGYASGAVDLCAAGFGAPHIRQRLWWVGSRLGDAPGGRERAGVADHGRGGGNQRADQAAGVAGGMADPNSDGRSKGERHDQAARHGHPAASAGNYGGLGNSRVAASERHPGKIPGAKAREHGARITVDGPVPVGLEHAGTGVLRMDDTGRSGPTNGFWRDADWLFCRDGKWRPVEPGTSPLAHGAAARVGRLRGYGNAINAEAAQAFIESVMETMK